MTVPSPGFLSWALLDRRSGGFSGSENLAESITTTQSMIKSWIVSDFLRQNDPTEEQLSQSAAAIIDSDDNATESLYQAGGGDAMVERMVAMCGLTETEVTSDVNCLALHQDWALAVLMGYPNELPLQVGADLAKEVTSTLAFPR